MNSDEFNWPEEQGSRYEDFYKEEIDEKCPCCGSPKMTRYMESNGPDDYRYVYECKTCGATQSE